jgi:hypothetical protein
VVGWDAAVEMRWQGVECQKEADEIVKVLAPVE